MVACALAAVLAALAVYDLRRGRLPDWLTLPLAAAGLLIAWSDGSPADAAMGAALGFAIFEAVAFGYRRLRGREGLGGGDAKLAAAAGAWVGWQGLPSVVLLAAAGALVVALARRRLGGTESVPFGAYLAPAILLVWLTGPLL